MFFFFNCTKCGFTLMASNSQEIKNVFKCTCRNCGAYHYFYFDKLTRKQKKKMNNLKGGKHEH